MANVIENPGAYRGTIARKANVGITNEKLKELWDADHPDDPLNV